MKKIVLNFLFSVVFIFYSISALEINVFGIENTFFDNFDTYIESKEQGITKENIYENGKDCQKIFFEESYVFSGHVLHNELKKNHADYFLAPSFFIQKLYLLHSVWII